MHIWEIQNNYLEYSWLVIAAALQTTLCALAQHLAWL